MAIQQKTSQAVQTPRVQLELLRGWDKLIPHDQQIIQKETQALTVSIYEVGKARLRIGEHLTRVRDILEPKKMFVKYLDTLGFARATAYRFMDNYLMARTILPTPIMQVALMRGSDTINARLVKAFPPPKSNDVGVINDYLDVIEQKERGEPPAGSDDQIAESYKRECLNFIRVRWSRLPASMNKRAKTAWMNDLRGMTLTLQGISNPLTIEASAIPEGYVRPRGRPRAEKKAG
jgi:hypothetical protein